MSDPGQQTSSRSPRLTQWVAFLIFSTITLGSSVEIYKHRTESSYSRWAMACSAITFIVTLVVVCMHLNSVSSTFIAGTMIEGIICLVLCVFWAATVSFISDSRHQVAVDSDGAVSNGNLYYFSWAGFVTSVTLLVSYLRSAFSVDVAGEIKTRSARLNLWAAHLASSLIVMGACINIYYVSNKCDATSGEFKFYRYCNRTLFGFVLGLLSSLIALAIVGMKIATSRAPFLVEAILSILLLVSYAFGVAYITSQQGPGAPLGNLYYFTWISFLTSFFLTASCVEDYNAATAMTAEDPDGTRQVEFEEDQI